MPKWCFLRNSEVNAQFGLSLRVPSPTQRPPLYASTRYGDPKQPRTKDKVFTEESEEDILANCPAQSQRGKSKINGDMLGVNSNNSHDMGTTTAEGKSPTNLEDSKEGMLRSDTRILSKERSPRRERGGGGISFQTWRGYLRKVRASMGGRLLVAQ
jgi:hypothetical protein